MAWLAAGGVFWLARREGKAPRPAWVAIITLACAGLVPLAGYAWSFTPYHILVKVVGPRGVALDGAKVWSSVQNESTKVDGGWRIDIPAESVPADRTVLVWATLDPADFTHSKSLSLANDHQPAITIRITGDRSAQVSGQVRDRDGRHINGAVVSLAGEPDTAAVTLLDGNFSVPVRAQPGDQVELQVAALGKLQIVWATAGDNALVIILDGP